MKQGFLWYDNDPKKTMASKLAEAAVRFRTKFGSEPTLCYLNPGDMTSAKTIAGKVKFIESESILPHHFWLEINE